MNNQRVSISLQTPAQNVLVALAVADFVAYFWKGWLFVYRCDSWKVESCLCLFVSLSKHKHFFLSFTCKYFMQMGDKGSWNWNVGSCGVGHQQYQSLFYSISISRITRAQLTLIASFLLARLASISTPTSRLPLFTCSFIFAVQKTQ
jgi:hypothetical protein